MAIQSEHADARERKRNFIMDESYDSRRNTTTTATRFVT
jgi:hypothetical protein